MTPPSIRAATIKKDRAGEIIYTFIESSCFYSRGFYGVSRGFVNITLLFDAFRLYQLYVQVNRLDGGPGPTPSVQIQ